MTATTRRTVWAVVAPLLRNTAAAPTGYRMMLKRQKQGEAMCTSVQMEAVIGMSAASDPDEPASTWQTLRQALDDGFHSIDRRLKEHGPLEPERFSLEDANQR